MSIRTLALLYGRSDSASAAVVDYAFTSAALPSGVTFARASSGTRFNASGVMVSEAANVPRFDYDPITLALRGLCVEPQRTNALWNYLVSSWNTNGTAKTGAAPFNAPDGSGNTMTVTENTATGAHIIFQGTQYVAWGNYYTYSAVLKAGTEYIVQLTFQASFFGNAYANFNLATKEVSSIGAAWGLVAVIQDLGNGWCRCSLTAICAASGNDTSALRMTNNNPTAGYSPSYTGTSKYFYAWSAQREEAGKGSSLIPTSGSAVTRSADVVQFTIPSGVATLRYTFDDNSTQDVAVSAGAYTVPTNLNRAWIKRIQSV